MIPYDASSLLELIARPQISEVSLTWSITRIWVTPRMFLKERMSKHRARELG